MCSVLSNRTVERVSKAVPYLLSSRRKGDPLRLVADSIKLRRALRCTAKMAGIEQIVATAWEYRDKRQQAAFSRALREIAGQGKLVKTGQSFRWNEGTGQYWGTYCGCTFHSPYARDYHVPWPPPRDSEIAWLVQARDDGRFAVIELVARSRSAFSAAL